MKADDRVKLGEAMGLRLRRTLPHKPNSPGCYIHDKPRRCWRAFDPFTDANDDYAVLEWMREKHHENAVASALLLPGDGHGFSAMKQRYYVGDYARAALQVINDE